MLKCGAVKFYIHLCETTFNNHCRCKCSGANPGLPCSFPFFHTNFTHAHVSTVALHFVFIYLAKLKKLLCTASVPYHTGYLSFQFFVWIYVGAVDPKDNSYVSNGLQLHVVQSMFKSIMKHNFHFGNISPTFYRFDDKCTQIRKSLVQMIYLILNAHHCLINESASSVFCKATSMTAAFCVWLPPPYTHRNKA